MGRCVRRGALLTSRVALMLDLALSAPTHRTAPSHRPRREVRQSTGPGRTCDGRSPLVRARRARRRSPQCRQYIEAQLKAAGITVSRTAVRCDDAGRRHQDDQRHRDDPGTPPERIVLATHYDTKLSGVHVPRRKRRGLVNGRGPGAGARAQDAAERIHDRAAVPRRRGSGQREWRDPRQHLRQPHYVQAAQKAGTLGGAEGAHPPRHDRRSGSRHPAATPTRLAG